MALTQPQRSGVPSNSSAPTDLQQWPRQAHTLYNVCPARCLPACLPASYLPAAFDSPTAACAMLDARFALETTPASFSLLITDDSYSHFPFISIDVWYVTF